MQKNTICTLAKDARNRNIIRKKRQTAFTLAEVLITLGIIGIVAAMTLPALITRNQNKALEASVWLPSLLFVSTSWFAVGPFPPAEK